MKKHILLSLIAGITVTMPAIAQKPQYNQFPQYNQSPQYNQLPQYGRFPRHEVSIYGTLGWSFLSNHYTSDVFSSKNNYSNPNGGGGLGYTFFFHSQYGITTGIEIASFATAVYGGVYGAEITESAEGSYSDGNITEPMYFNSTFQNYKETQRATYVHIPLLLQFQTGDVHKYYLAAGVKTGFALSGKYETSATNFTTSGYFPETSQTFTNMPNHGFITVQEFTHTDAIDFGLNISLAVETGIRWTAGNHTAIYTGLYLDYGLLDTSPEKTTAGLVTYQSGTNEFAYNSVLTAQQPSSGTHYTDKLHLLSIGLKFRIAFSR